MFNSKLKKSSISNFEDSVKKYNILAEQTRLLATELMVERQRSVQIIDKVENFINSIANTSKVYEKDFGEIEVYVSRFKKTSDYKLDSQKVAIINGGAIGAGVAAGVGVAAFGPTAAMAIATTFGTASTGTAIAALSGAAAQNAALAWLGGGALVAGGGGMSAGTALLGLAGPIGWTIGGVALVGGGAFATFKNKQIAEDAYRERLKVESIIGKFTGYNKEIILISDLTIKHTNGLEQSLMKIFKLEKNNYLEFSENEKLELGSLVNNTLSLAKLLDRNVNTN